MKNKPNQEEEPRPTIDGVVFQMLHQARTMQGQYPDIAKALKAGALDFYERPPNEKGSVIWTLKTQLKVLSYPTIREIMGQDEFQD